MPETPKYLYDVAERTETSCDGLASIASTSAIGTTDTGADVMLRVFVTDRSRYTGDSCLISTFLAAESLYYLVPRVLRTLRPLCGRNDLNNNPQYKEISAIDEGYSLLSLS